MAINVGNAFTQASKALTPKVAGTGTRAAARSHQGGVQRSPFDVWTNTGKGIAQNTTDTLNDPIGTMGEALKGRGRQLRNLAPDKWDSIGLSDLDDALIAGSDDVVKAAEKIAKAQGALATTGAVFGLLTSLEQMISMPLSVIPFPALPAVRVTDYAVGLPHAHSHPPNLVPPNPVPVPFPSTGPVIPIPFISGAARVLINNMPAARCGDMGLSIFCGGFFPMYEIFLGSSSVWLEGARAARIGVDITKHCIFSTPKPSDPPLGPMIGATVMSSPNVIVGGIPMPSLLGMAMGKAFKAAFKGLGKLKSLGKAADDVAEEGAEALAKNADNIADDAAGFSRMANGPQPSVGGANVMNLGRVAREAPGGPLGAFRSVREVLDSNAIVIGGDPKLRHLVEDDLMKLAKSPAGRELLEHIKADKAKHGTSCHINAQPKGKHTGPVVETPPGFGKLEPDPIPGVPIGPHTHYKPGTPCSSTTTYTPGPSGQMSKNTPSDVVLAHELQHANNAQRGILDPRPNTAKGWTKGSRDEFSTVARENQYRADRGLPQRGPYNAPLP